MGTTVIGVEQAGRGRHAVDVDLGAVLLAAVDGEIRVLVGVHGNVAELAVRRRRSRHAGRQLHQAERAPAVERNALNLAVVHDLARARRYPGRAVEPRPLPSRSPTIEPDFHDEIDARRPGPLAAQCRFV